MFTGIIEEVGNVCDIKKFSGGEKITITAEKVIVDIEIGDSIAINGVCLSVTELYDDGFQAQAVQETLDKSNLQDIKKNELVNLERPLSVNDRFDGHIVQGHVDGTGTFISKTEQGKSAIIKIKMPQNLLKYVVKKGSIAINGVSLTVADIKSKVISIAVIPITLQDTNLGLLNNGDAVNIEVDILAKYIERNMRTASGIKDIKENMKKWGY
ncbi:MAG: riboflavin synthase [Candidatus Marinimicrobia bacterium]|nr:riboflavin synthase [Candidatus Neomarinimicrobiota bacterium]